MMTLPKVSSFNRCFTLGSDEKGIHRFYTERADVKAWFVRKAHWSCPKLHREDGPAIIALDGERWFLNGLELQGIDLEWHKEELRRKKNQDT